MSSRASIEFDFNRAKQQATRLDDAADQLKRIAENNFQNTMQGISSSWTGENSRNYLAKGTELQKQMLNTAKNLKTIASEIRGVAQRIYNAEMQALRIAEERERQERARAAAAAAEAAKALANSVGSSLGNLLKK
jgi:uncharacterized protein YukE